MIRFPINNRFTGAVQFTAPIDCSEDAPSRVKVGLAVKWAVENKVSLRGANLRGANLRGADLRGADLSYANLRGANLRDADLSYAYLRGANLSGANLGGADLGDADLRDADLSDAYLRGADLRDADLSDADLSGADLRDADLSGADLRGADLGGANLRGATMNSPYGRSIATDIWTVVYTHDFMQIGCEGHAIADWWGFEDDRIADMDDQALEWWKRWKPILQQIVETAPRHPTGAKEKQSGSRGGSFDPACGVGRVK